MTTSDIVGGVAAPTPRGGRSRPPDRGRRIVETASRLFTDHGYERVRLDDIATDVGVTARAIYRYFPNKYSLLERLISDALDALEACLPAVDDPRDSRQQLDEALAAMTRFSLERRGVCVLLVREARHLTPTDRSRRDARMNEITGRLCSMLRACRPDLSDEQADLFVWYCIAVLASTSFHHTPISGVRARRVLANMTTALVETPWPGQTSPTRLGSGEIPSGRRPPARAPGVSRRSTREALLDAATALFARDGAAGVRMGDLAFVVGISAPSIYEHFASKSELLMATLMRGVTVLQVSLSEAISGASSPGDALDRALRSYVAFSLDHHELMVVFLDEAVHLDDTARSTLRRAQGAYFAEIVSLVAAVGPHLADAEAAVVAHGVLQIANETARSGRGSDLPDAEDVLVALITRLVRAA